MFMHGGLLHLGGNMLFLWIFGNNVEDALGRDPLPRLLPRSAGSPRSRCRSPSTRLDGPTLGASGAIAAVLGGYILLYPRARVLTCLHDLLLHACSSSRRSAFLGIWFAEQIVVRLAGLTSRRRGGGVAYFAHIGGFAFGLLADPAVRRGGARRAAMMRWRRPQR